MASESLPEPGRESRPTKVRGRFQLVKRWRTPLVLPGGVMGTMTVIWVTKLQWKRLEESRDRSWNPLEMLGFVFAWQLKWAIEGGESKMAE